MVNETASPVPGRASLMWLSILLVLIALITSRVTLVVHEFIAHGGAVVALGSTVDDFRLFLFGGGWVSFHRSPAYSVGESLAISVAGIALELAVGGALIAIAARLRRGSPARALVIAFGAIDIVHALYYLAAGTHHGFGDGRVLHVLLGDWRPVAVGAVSAALLALAMLVSRWFATEVSPWLTARTTGRRLVQLLAAAAVAGVVHGALYLAEQAVTDDPTYAEVMKQQSQRDVERELAAREAQRQMTPAELAALRAALETRYRPFPVKQLLLVAVAFALAVGAIAGVQRGRAAVPVPLRGRQLLPIAIALAASLAVVLVLRSPWWR